MIDIYVAMEDGVWLYEPTEHQLLLHMPGDLRGATGPQDFAATAALDLIYVANGDRMDVPAEEQRRYASVDAAVIGQNVYLFCASEGLGTVFRSALDSAKLGQLLNLRDQVFVNFAQTVGYPARE